MAKTPITDPQDLETKISFEKEHIKLLAKLRYKVRHFEKLEKKYNSMQGDIGFQHAIEETVRMINSEIILIEQRQMVRDHIKEEVKVNNFDPYNKYSDYGLDQNEKNL